MKLGPISRSLHLFLVLQFLWSQVFLSCSALAQNPPTASTQSTTGNLAGVNESESVAVGQGTQEFRSCINEGSLGIALGCMRQSFAWVAANPTLPVAIKTLSASRDLLQKHQPLNAMAMALRGRNGANDLINQCLAGNEACLNDPFSAGCTDAKSACEHVAMNKYIQTKHNALINALATATNVAEITNNMGNPKFKEAVLAATLDVVPRNVTGVFLGPLPSETSAVDPGDRTVVNTVSHPYAENANIPVESLIRSVRDNQRTTSDRIRGDVTAFKQAIILENVKSLLRNYWMFQGLYQRPMPRENTIALRQVFGSSNGFNRFDLQELNLVLDETRAYLMTLEQTHRRSRSQNQAELLTQLNDSRALLDAEATKLRKIAKAGEVITTLREMIQYPGVTPPSEHYTAEQRRWIQSVSIPMSELLGTVPPSRCHADGRVEMTQAIREAVRSVFARMVPGHQNELVTIFEAYLARQLPARSVPPVLSDRCGFNRNELVMSFFDTVFQVSFGVNREQMLPTQSDGIHRDSQQPLHDYIFNNEYLNTKMNDAKLREISQNPLLYTQALRSVYDVLGNTTSAPAITLAQLRAALLEQATGITANLNELEGYLNVPAGQDQAMVGKLIIMNPRAAWRVVARDWSFLGQLSRGYHAAEDARLQREAREHVLFWAALGLGAAALITGGASLLASTPAMGAILFGVATGFGLVGGTLGTYSSATNANATYREYQFARNAVIAGLQNDAAEIQRAEQLFEQYESQLNEALISGALTIIDVILITRVIRTIGQVVERIRYVRSLPRMGVAGEIINISEEELARVGGRALVARNAEASAINRAAGVHPELSGDDFLKLYLENPAQLTARFGQTQADEFITAIGLASRRHSRSMGDMLRQSFDNGMTLDQLASDVFQGLKKAGPSAVSDYPGWVARLKNFSGSAQSFGRPMITSVGDANRFGTILTEALYRRSFRAPTVASSFRKSFVRILVDRDWTNSNPLKIFFDDLATHGQRNPMDLVDVMIAEDLAPTGDFLADAFSPAARAGMGTESTTGRLSQGLWENIAHLSSNPARMRNAIGGLRFATAGLSFAFFDLATADDLYDLGFQHYLKDKVLCTNESVGNGRQVAVPSQAQLDLATQQEWHLQQCRRFENELPRLRREFRICEQNIAGCRIGTHSPPSAELVESTRRRIEKFEYDLSTCERSNFDQKYISVLASIRGTHCLDPAVY